MHLSHSDDVGILRREEEKCYQDKDTIIIEDNTGRLKILKNEIMNPK